MNDENEKVLYNWIINLVDGKSYAVINGFSTYTEFNNYITNGRKSGHYTNHELTKSKEIDGVTVNAIFIECSKIASVMYQTNWSV